MNSATTGLQVAIAAAGIEPGDEVIVSPYTMSASAAAVVLHDAIPVFADVEDSTYGLDPAAVRAAITAAHSRRARDPPVRPPGAHGRALDDRPRTHSLAIIEDAAQSIGATWRGAETGTLGTVGVLSLNYHKIIHSGEGGMVLTQDDRAAQIARLVRNHGEAVVDELGIDASRTRVGSNYRLGEIHAAIAVEQLKKLDPLLAHRRELGEVLTGRLGELPGIEPAEVAEGARTPTTCIRSASIFDELEGVTRDAIAKALEAEGIPVSQGYVRPLYLQAHVPAAHRARDEWRSVDLRALAGRSLVRGRNLPRRRAAPRERAAPARRLPGPARDADDVEDVADAFEKVLANLDALREIEVA